MHSHNAQNLFAPVTRLPEQPPADPATAHLDENCTSLNVSVNQMLGHDYVFLHSGPLHLEDTTSVDIILDLLEQLQFEPYRSVLITVTEEPEGPRFVRHDLERSGGKAHALSHQYLDSPEQREFMAMLWEGSTEI
jgi:hypothetical protein